MPSLYDLAYPSEGSMYYAMPPHSPIHYERAATWDSAGRENEGGLNEYDDSYIFQVDNSTHYRMPSMFPIEEASRLLACPAVQADNSMAAHAIPQSESIYLGMPWVQWWEGCGHPGY